LVRLSSAFQPDGNVRCNLVGGRQANQWAHSLRVLRVLAGKRVGIFSGLVFQGHIAVSLERLTYFGS
jgi:hypothetical protein